MRKSVRQVVVLPEPLSPEKTREAIGVNHAFSHGDCDKCRYLALCESRKGFRFPSTAACMVYARTIDAK